MGTFRAFQAAAAGRFHEAFLLDNNEGVIRFNRWHLKVLQESESRRAYLVKLFGDAGLLGAFRDYDAALAAHDPQVLHHTHESLKVKLSPLVEKGAEEMSTEHERYLKTMAEFILDKTTYLRSFLGSDAQFLNLRAMVVAQQITVVPGSLSGTKVMNWLGDRMRAKGQVVAVLDISNAYDYIGKFGGAKQFFKNIERWPFADQARVHFTAMGSRRSGLDWDYFSEPAAGYISAARSFVKSRLDLYGGNYSPYLLSLRPLVAPPHVAPREGLDAPQIKRPLAKPSAAPGFCIQSLLGAY